jgi:hypothetical protein
MREKIEKMNRCFASSMSLLIRTAEMRDDFVWAVHSKINLRFNPNIKQVIASNSVS